MGIVSKYPNNNLKENAKRKIRTEKLYAEKSIPNIQNYSILSESQQTRYESHAKMSTTI